MQPDEVPDDLVDLFIATTHPGKGTIEARRVALAAFAMQYADAERQKLADALEAAVMPLPDPMYVEGWMAAAKFVRGES